MFLTRSDLRTELQGFPRLDFRCINALVGFAAAVSGISGTIVLARRLLKDRPS